MTLIAGLPNAEATSRKMLLPVSQGLKAIHLLNGSVEKAARNFALGGPDGAVIGNPVVGAGFVTFQGLASYIQTQIEETTEATIFCAARSLDTFADDAHRPMLYGTFQSPAAAGGGNTFGISAAMLSSVQINGYAARGTSTSDDTSTPAAISAGNTASWALYSQAVPNISPTVLRDHTNNLIDVDESSVARFRSTGKFRIGSGFTQFGGSCQLALWVYYDRVLSTTERDDTVAKLRQYLSTYQGITV